MGRPMIDLTGQRFGKLSVIRPTRFRSPKGEVAWRCRCDCGRFKNYLGTLLKRKRKPYRSCGCQVALIKHGFNRRGLRSRFYTIWSGMLQRTANTKHPAYQDYGKRGIRTFNEWEKFENFHRDMYPSYIVHVALYGKKQT